MAPGVIVLLTPAGSKLVWVTVDNADAAAAVPRIVEQLDTHSTGYLTPSTRNKSESSRKKE